MKAALISACYDSGHFGTGMGAGPQAILAAGLVDRLTASGHDVVASDIGQVGDRQGREIATGFAVCRAVSEAVSAARREDRLPVVLAGNCLTAAGAVAGEGAEAVVWFDQHGDLNTPETSAYGFLDGMAFAVTLGLCWKPMAAAIPGVHPVDPARCVLVDGRDLDPDEVDLLERLPIARADCPAAAAAAVERCSKVPTHIHLDLDIHDSQVLSVNRYAAPGGPEPQAVREAVCAVARAVPVSGLTITAYDPAFDVENRVPGAVAELLIEFLAANEAAR
mgnify:CR=1 FL=1